MLRKSEAIIFWQNLATKYHREHKNKDCVAACLHLIEIDVDTPDYRIRLAEALLRDEQNENAHAQFCKAGDLFAQEAQYEHAVRNYENALQIKFEPNIAKKTAQMYLELKFIDGIQPCEKIQHLLQFMREDPECLLILARSFERCGLTINQSRP